MEGLSSESLLAFSVAAFAVLAALFRFTYGRSNASELPPGRLGWPIIRENLSYYRSTSKLSMFDFLQPRVSRYGKIFTSHLFGSLVVVSIDAQFNKWAMQNEGKLFKAQYPTSFRETTGKYGILNVEGDLHRKLHGIAVNLLTGESLKSNFLTDVDSLVKARVNTWIGREINFQQECYQMVSDLMCKQLLDLDPSQKTKQIVKDFHAFSDTVICFPLRFPGTTFYKGLKAKKALVVTILEAIKDREEHPEVPHNDLLTRLIREEKTLPREAVIEFILFMLLAGHETSSRAMGFSIKYLTENQMTLQRLKEEHDQLLENKEEKSLTFEDYTSMKYTHYVINETLRIGNISTIIPREALADVQAQGHAIPKGTTVILVPYGVHTDVGNYDSPWTFDPDRWQSKEQVKAGSDSTFVPFGGGPRMCPGAQLARLEVAFLLHYFVTCCRWEMLKQDRITEFPFPRLVEGLPMRVYARDDK